MFIGNENKCLDRCFPISLQNLSICKNYEDLMCTQSIIGKYLLKDIKSCPKPCFIHEYFGEESLNYKQSKKGNDTEFKFLYRFNEAKPTTSYEEYFVYDWIATTGSIGGTLGLCIGFSFRNVVIWLLNFIQKLENLI